MFTGYYNDSYTCFTNWYSYATILWFQQSYERTLVKLLCKDSQLLRWLPCYVLATIIEYTWTVWWYMDKHTHSYVPIVIVMSENEYSGYKH